MGPPPGKRDAVLRANAILIWNTVHMNRIAGQLRVAGHLVRDEDLARVSSLAHAHTIPSGTYFQSPRRRADIAPEPCHGLISEDPVCPRPNA